MSDAAFSIVRLNANEVAQTGRLDTALEDAPGLSLFRRTSSLAANPTTQGVSLRAIAGSGASRALVTLDGRPLGPSGSQGASPARLVATGLCQTRSLA